MTEEQLRRALARGREQHGIEFKGPGMRTDRAFLAVVARAMMGMANRRDGGRVIIGVDEVDGGLDATGLSDGQLASWNYDHLSDSIAPYTDPFLDFDLEVSILDGCRLVVVTVGEFDEIPVICRRSHGDKLSDGTLYVRSRRKPRDHSGCKSRGHA